MAMIALASIGSAHAQLTTLVSFDGTNGESPLGGVTLSSDGSTLYGTTEGGSGTVFSVPVTGGPVDTLASGVGSYGDLTLSSDGSTLYGSNGSGGTDGAGSVFSVPVTGGAPTTLASFNEAIGFNPSGNLTLSGGILYGTTSIGGTGGGGTVFSVPVTGGGTPTTLVSFNGSNGGSSYGGLIFSGGTFYGTTAFGGANSAGTVFALDPTTDAITTLASFFSSSHGGYEPYGNLTLSSDGSTLYGTTEDGGANGDGTVFALNLTTKQLTSLASFDGTNGKGPVAGLTLSSDGDTLYGTTQIGGTSNEGTVFALNLGTDTLSTLVDFDGANGGVPWDDLVLSGNTLYGTTEIGGAHNDGTVFALDLQAAPEPSGWALGLIATGVLIGLRRHSRRARV